MPICLKFAAPGLLGEVMKVTGMVMVPHAGALDGDVCGHRAGALGCQGLVDANREAEAVNRQAPRSRGLVEHTRSDEITQVQRLDEGDIVERRPSGGKRRRYIRDDTASGIHVHELADV